MTPPGRSARRSSSSSTTRWGRILFGADYPHGRGGRDDQFYPMTLEAMKELNIPDADKDKIYYKNAQKLGF